MPILWLTASYLHVRQSAAAAMNRAMYLSKNDLAVWQRLRA
jgi:hypothetical protein